MATPKKSNTAHILIWAVQIILTGMFLMAGIMKTTTPINELSKSINWTADLPEALVRFIGACEFLGALGLILPSLFRIKPVFTPYAALGLITIMTFAIIFHISRSEMPAIGFNLMMALMAGVIAWGRLKKAPIQAR